MICECPASSEADLSNWTQRAAAHGQNITDCLSGGPAVAGRPLLLTLPGGGSGLAGGAGGLVTWWVGNLVANTAVRGMNAVVVRWSGRATAIIVCFHLISASNQHFDIKTVKTG